MKQFLSIVLLAFFLMGQVNLTLASHFCGDELMSTELSIAKEKADCCGEEDKVPMQCCDDEVTQADADDYFGKSKVDIKVSPTFILAYALTIFPTSTIDTQAGEFNSDEEDFALPDYHILYQTFLL